METRIAARLRDQLGTAKSANEMFRIFSRYNALFVRGHIRGAIHEYQTQLIQRVKDDIEGLHNKFKVHCTCIRCAYTACYIFGIQCSYMYKYTARWMVFASTECVQDEYNRYCIVLRNSYFDLACFSCAL